MHTRFTLPLLAVLLPWCSNAQTSDLYQQFKKQYPDEPAVFLNRAETLTILIEKDSLRAFSERTEDLLLLKEQAEAFSSRKVYGSSFMPVRNLVAKTLMWDKGKYKAVDVNEFKKNSDRDQSVFFDDSYSYSFNFPVVASQNRTQLNYTQDVKEIRFISGFVFPMYVPQNKVSYTIKTSKGVELFYEVQNDPQHKIQMNKSEKNGYMLYEWSAQNMETMRVEDDSPGIQYYAPQVVCYVKSYNTKKGMLSLFNH